MHTTRNIVSWLSVYLVGTFFFLSANIFALVTVLSPENVKQTLNEQRAYDKIVPAVLSGARYNAPIDSGQLPLSEPWVEEAAKKAFPSTDLQAKGNTVVNSTFAWLDGQTTRPQFSLDFSSNKEQLAQEIGSYTQNRLSGLPRCTLNNLPDTINAFTIDCLPFGVNPATIGNKVRSDIVTSQDFLKNPIISSGAVDQALSDTGQDPFSQLNGAGWLYQNRGLLQWLFPALTILFLIIGLALARNRVKATGRLGRIFLVTAVSLVAIAMLFEFGFELLINTVARDPVSREVIGPLIAGLAQAARTVYLVFAAGGVFIGVILLILQYRLRNKPGGETGIRTLGTR